MFDRSVSRTRDPRGRTARRTRASFVRRGDLWHGAKDQSFRFRKDLGLPNQVCLFRHCNDSALANGTQRPSYACRSIVNSTGSVVGVALCHVADGPIRAPRSFSTKSAPGIPQEMGASPAVVPARMAEAAPTVAAMPPEVTMPPVMVAVMPAGTTTPAAIAEATIDRPIGERAVA